MAPALRALVTAGVVVALDQVTKALVKDEVLPGEHVDLFPGLQLSNVRNTGVAFGALEGAGLAVAVLIGLSLTLLIGYFVANRELPLLWLPVGMLVGGAAGNLIDRAREGAVVDFIDPVGLAGLQRGRQLHRAGRAAAPVRGGEGGATEDRVDLTAGRGGRRHPPGRVPRVAHRAGARARPLSARSTPGA